MVSFNQVDSNGNGTFLFNLNINRSQPIVNDVVFDEVPDGSEIVSTVRDVLLDESVGLVSAPASVVGPFTPTTQPRELCVCVCVRACLCVCVCVCVCVCGGCVLCVVLSCLLLIKYTRS